MTNYPDVGMPPDYGRPEERLLPEPDEDIPPSREPRLVACQMCSVLLTADEFDDPCPNSIFAQSGTPLSHSRNMLVRKAFNG